MSAKVELKVRRPLMIHDNSTSSMIVMEGKKVTLECYANGNPIQEFSGREKIMGF